MKRYNYSMDTMTFKSLDIGNLKTLYTFPVIAGDSVEMSMGAIERMSPLRRYMVLSPQTDYFAFFVPHRHVYDGEGNRGDWVQFVQDGAKESENLGSVTVPTNRVFDCYGQQMDAGQSYPLHATRGYHQIWDRYFRVPSDNSSSRGFGEQSDNDFIPVTNGASALTGMPCAHLKTIWNTGLPDIVEDDDKEAPVVGGRLDVRALEQAKALYGTEQARMFFSHTDRYKDTLSLAFGSGKGLNIDADQRPELLAHSANHIEGRDVDGTGDTSLGTFSGKGLGQKRFGFPKKYFGEHGVIWIMALCRYPTVLHEEAHYLMRKVNPTYKEASGDPLLTANEPPQELEAVFEEIIDGNASDLENEVIPFGNYFRVLPTATVDQAYQNLDGFPFLNNSAVSGSYRGRHYVNPRNYDNIFQTQQLEHLTIGAKLMFNVKRVTPPAMTSVFTGA